MTAQVGIPQEAWEFLSDMVDNCVGMNDSSKEVLILAHKDGLYGGDDLIDEEAISWVSTAFTSRGHRVSILWADDPSKSTSGAIPPSSRRPSKAPIS